MKKIVSIVTTFLVIFVFTFSINIFAASLGNINVGTDKTVVNPGKNVKVNVNFGTNLGSYTVDVAYDNNIFEYVSSEGGTASDNGTRVRVYYFDQTGGSSPRSTMSVTFKAKAGITSSNPTDFAITAEGLANPDASVEYDDITTPIKTEVVVEPNYVDYTIKLSYEGYVIKNEKENMELIIASSMGRNYKHTRVLVDVVSPEGATAKLLAKKEQGVEYDVIENGWGAATGDAIGGKDVLKQLPVTGIFNKAGTYKITLRLIDLDSSNEEIAKSTANITVKDTQATTPGNGTTGGSSGGNTQKEPTVLPQTGNTIYLTVLPILAILTAAYIVLKKKD